MPLLGAAAMALFFDVVPEAVAEHDRWHSEEHLPERLSIPGFLRGSRWTARAGAPRYFVLYEVEDIGVLSSAAYLERLNNPTPWTRRMMQHYRGMSRTFCTVTASVGADLGAEALVIRDPAGKPPLAEWSRLGAAHLLESAATPAMTNKQAIRGKDTSVGSIVMVSGDGVAGLAASTAGSLYRLEDSRR